jgi:hypothetical protein
MDRSQLWFNFFAVVIVIDSGLDYYYNHVDEKYIKCPYDIGLWNCIETVLFIFSARICIYGLRRAADRHSRFFKALVWVINPILSLGILVCTIVGTVQLSRIITDAEQFSDCSEADVGWHIAGLIFLYLFWAILAFFSIVLIALSTVNAGFMGDGFEDFDDVDAEPAHLSEAEIAAMPLGIIPETE